MNLKEKVEENTVLWLLGFLVTGFLSGIGAYKAILEIAQLTVVPKSAEVVSLRGEVKRLKNENQRLRDEKEEREKADGPTDLEVEELSTLPAEPARNTSTQPQAGTPAPQTGKGQGALEGKFSGTIVLKDGSETQCRDISFREMHFDIFQYWWDPEKVKSWTEMSFEDIQSLQPGALRKVDNVNPDFIEVRLTRVDGKTITVYSLSNYEFYCNEENLPRATAFPMTQMKEIKISPGRQREDDTTTSGLTPSDVLPVLLRKSTSSLATAETANKFRVRRWQWTGIVADVRRSPSGETIVDLLHDVNQQRAASSFSKDQMRWWKDRWRDTILYLKEDQKQRALSLSKGDSLLYSGKIDGRTLETPVCCLVIKGGEIIKREGGQKGD